MIAPRSELLDRTPPHDLEAERCLLGAVLFNPPILTDVAAMITPADWYSDQHRAVWEAMLSMDADGTPLDLPLLTERLRRLKTFERAGGNTTLGEIAESGAMSAHAEHYAKTVRQKARYRSLIAASLAGLKAAYCEDGEPEAICDDLEAAILKADPIDGRPVEASAAAVDALAAIQERISTGERAGTMTGLREFDERVGGLFPGELCILAARPGIGKTSLACQIAYQSARRGRPVYFVSLEMGATELVTRVICSQADVSSKLVRTGKLDSHGLNRLSAAAQPFASLQWCIHAKPSMTVAEIRRWARRIARRGLSLVVVDYLQLLTPQDRRISRHEQVGQLSKALKELAREVNVPVLCLTQLSREAEKDAEPRLHHLRESGSIEQDADMVAFLYAPSKSEKDRVDATGVPGEWNAFLKLAKNRNGELCKLRLLWQPERTMFSDPTVQPFDGFE